MLPLIELNLEHFSVILDTVYQEDTKFFSDVQWFDDFDNVSKVRH